MKISQSESLLIQMQEATQLGVTNAPLLKSLRGELAAAMIMVKHTMSLENMATLNGTVVRSYRALEAATPPAPTSPPTLEQLEQAA